MPYAPPESQPENPQPPKFSASIFSHDEKLYLLDEDRNLLRENQRFAKNSILVFEFLAITKDNQQPIATTRIELSKSQFQDFYRSKGESVPDFAPLSALDFLLQNNSEIKSVVMPNTVIISAGEEKLNTN